MGVWDTFRTVAKEVGKAALKEAKNYAAKQNALKHGDYRDSFDEPETEAGPRMIACEICRGSGISECTMEYGDMEHPDNCPACGGEQTIICPYCNGTDKVEDRER